MIFKRIATAGLVAAFTMTPVSRAFADGSDFAAGLVGGLIAGAVINDVNKKNKKKATTTKSSGSSSSSASSVEREQNRDLQTALNYFSFPVGTPDGSIGPQSRAAISEFQAYMGYAATGQITEFERSFLANSMFRAEAGGDAISQAMVQSPDGVRGLLIVFRDEMAAGNTTTALNTDGQNTGGLPPDVAAAVDQIARDTGMTVDALMQKAGFIQLVDLNGDGRTDYVLNTAATGNARLCTGQSCEVQVYASTGHGYQRNDFLTVDASPANFSCVGGSCTLNAEPPGTVTATAPLPEAVPVVQPLTVEPEAAEPAASGTLAFPSFIEPGGPQIALASHCNKVQLATTQNGGFLTADAVNWDANVALSEQFCLVRSLAMAESDALSGAVAGFTPQQIADQCISFAPALQSLVVPLSLETREAVIGKVEAFDVASGKSAAQLSATAHICLGVGYTANNLDVAIGSALILTALGEAGFAEIIGHHLSQGFGTAPRPDLALAWYEAGLGAATSAYATNVPDRAELIRKAAFGASEPMVTEPEAIPIEVIPVEAIPTEATLIEAESEPSQPSKGLGLTEFFAPYIAAAKVASP